MVLHSLVRLGSELWSSNPVKGKIAAFVGEVQPGLATPNLVVFDEELEVFALAVFPMIKVKSVVEYYKEPREYLPGVAKMINEDPKED